jgi:hypothetical protein
VDSGPILPVPVDVIAKVFDEFWNKMSIDGFVFAARDGNARWAEVAGLATDPIEGGTVKCQDSRRAKLPTFTLLNCVNDHTASTVELKQTVSWPRLLPATVHLG